MRVHVIAILVHKKDDIQAIFESLNSKGKPLSAMDLVSNNILHLAKNQNLSPDQLFTEFLKKFREDWWKASTSKPKRPRIDHFLAHAITAQTGVPLSLRKLYFEYRDFVKP